MEKKSINNLIIIRYSIYILIALSIAFFNKSLKIIDLSKLVLLLLLYIINSQLRLYFFNKISDYIKRHISILISLLCEILIIAALYYNFGGFTFIYYFICILDTVVMLPKVQGIFIIAICYGAIALQSFKPDYFILQHNPLINILFNTIIVAGIIQLGSHIEEEKHKKSEAQRLYDQIRISEEKLKEAYAKLEQYSNTVEEITLLRERNRISREIHDTVGHTLSTLIIQLQAVPFVIKANPYDAQNMINDMVSYTKNGLEDVRRAVRELKPSNFDDNNGLFIITELVSNFQKNTGIIVNFIISKNQYSLTQDQSFILYRIFQESLNNAVRHGKATEININMDFADNLIYVHIKDNGKGSGEINNGCGLNNINDRIRSIGGRAEYHTSPGKGFEINLSMPRIQNIAELQ